MGHWIGKCPKCGAKLTRLKVMEEAEDQPTREEAVARSIMGVVSTKRMALKCQQEKCGHIQIIRINHTKK